MAHYIVLFTLLACTLLGLFATSRNPIKNQYDFKTGLALGTTSGFLSAFIYLALIHYIFLTLQKS